MELAPLINTRDMPDFVTSWKIRLDILYWIEISGLICDIEKQHHWNWHLLLTVFGTLKGFRKMMKFLSLIFTITLFNSLPPSLLISFAKSLDSDQARQNVGPDQDPNCLTPRWYSWKIFRKKMILKKFSRRQEHENYQGGKELTSKSLNATASYLFNSGSIIKLTFSCFSPVYLETLTLIHQQVFIAT